MWLVLFGEGGLEVEGGYLEEAGCDISSVGNCGLLMVLCKCRSFSGVD